MGLFDALIRTAISPVTIAVKTVDKVCNEEWTDADIFTGGISKVGKAVADEAEKIVEKLDKDD